MQRRGAVHCLHTHRWPRLETGPQHQLPRCQRRMPGQFVPQKSHAAPWRLRASRRLRNPGQNSSACHVQESAENAQRAKPHQEHSCLSINRCHPQQTPGFNQCRSNRSGTKKAPARSRGFSVAGRVSLRTTHRERTGREVRPTRRRVSRTRKTPRSRKGRSLSSPLGIRSTPAQQYLE
jgi:hypothetical protein